MPARSLLPSLALAATLLFAAFPRVRADDALPLDLASEVARRVVDLDAGQRSVRREAEEALVELGPEILPHLPPPDRLPTASSREAVRRIRVQLERRRARESVRASTVTLEGTRTLEDWLAEIERQTGNGLDPSSVPDEMLERRMTLSIDERPFWEVVDDTLRSARLAVGSGGTTEDRLPIVPTTEGTPEPLRIARVGGFRITLDGLDRRPRFGHDDEEIIRASFTVLAEPRLRPLFLRYGGRSLSLRMAGNTSAVPLDPEAKFDLPLGTGHGAARLDFVSPRTTEAIDLDLAGTFEVTVAADEARFRFPPLDETEDVARRRGGVTVRVTDIDLEPAGDTQRAKVAVNVVYDTGGPAFESHRTWVYSHRAHLEHTSGQRIEFRPPATTVLQSDGGIGIRYAFEGLTDPGEYRFVYAAPTMIVEVPLEFAWRSLTIAAP